MNQSSRCRGDLHSGQGRVLVLGVSFAVIDSSQALIKARMEVLCLFGLGLWAGSFPLF